MATTYITQYGDMWDQIAKDVYGDERRASDLMLANPEHLRTVIFGGGIELNCPDIVTGTDIELPEWRQ